MGDRANINASYGGRQSGLDGEAIMSSMGGAVAGGGGGTPAPVFSTQPSMSPTSGTAGTTLFTATDGVASNTTGYTRRWLLSGTSIGTGTTVTPATAGNLVLEVTATGPGGSTIATTAASVISAGATVPGAPTLAVTPGNAQNSIAWTDGSTGGSAITTRKLYRSTTSDFTPGSGNLITTNPTFPYADTGLTNGTTYYYKGIATNVIGDSLASTQQSGAPANATPLVAAYRDDFTTGAGTLNGRTITGLASYVTVLEDTPGGSTVNALQVATTGRGTLGGTSANGKARGYRVPITTYDYAVTQLGSGFTSAQMNDHVSADGVPFTGLVIQTNANLYTRINPTVAGTPTTNSLTNSHPFNGDVIERRYSNSGGVDYGQFFMRGLQIGLATGTWTSDGRFNLTAASVPVTGKHGWNGSLPALAVDSHEGGDMAVVSRIMRIDYGRVAQANADGTVTYRGKFAYTGAAPSTIKYRVRALADNSILASGTATGLSIDAPSNLGFATVGFTPASLATSYCIDLYRDDAVDALGAPAQIMGLGSGVQWGEVYGTDGQSLTTQSDAAAATATAPANCFKFDISGDKADIAKVSIAVVANFIPASFINAAFPSKPVLYIAGGKGASSITTRGAGSVLAKSMLDAVDAAGGKIRAIAHYDGQSDVSALATYKTTLIALYAERFSRLGNFPVLLGPVAAMIGYAEESVESLRRFQGFEMPAADSRFTQGPFTIDLPHTFAGSVIDTLHLTAASYVEMKRREALILLNKMDPATNAFARRGPTIVSAVKIDNSTVDVTFALNGFTGLSLLNSSYTTNKTDTFDGGVRFGSAVGTVSGLTKGDGTTALSTITTRIAATAASIGTPSGGQVVVRFTLATPITGTIYVGGPYGANPFNRSNDNAINLDLGNLASMFVGTYASEPNVGIQPYWHTSGNDYVVAA